jgi:hypothetical protein
VCPPHHDDDGDDIKRRSRGFKLSKERFIFADIWHYRNMYESRGEWRVKPSHKNNYFIMKHKFSCFCFVSSSFIIYKYAHSLQQNFQLIFHYFFNTIFSSSLVLTHTFPSFLKSKTRHSTLDLKSRSLLLSLIHWIHTKFTAI